jgi:hypothetical protein
MPFSSAKCPASLIPKAHDYAKEIRDNKMGIISGFHAPAVNHKPAKNQKIPMNGITTWHAFIFEKQANFLLGLFS